MFTIPSRTSAFARNPQSIPMPADIDAIIAGIGSTGVVSGCAVSAQGSPNMTVAVAVGVAMVSGTYVAVAAGNVTITAADASPRVDLIVVNNAGVKSAVAGVAVATGTGVGPEPAAMPANSTLLAIVLVPASATAIITSYITDKRVPAISVGPYAPQGRLSLQSGVPVSTTDQIGGSTIYYNHCGRGRKAWLYSGSVWREVYVPNISLALSGLTTDKIYDLYLDYNGGVPQLVHGNAWTNDTTRANALAELNGFWTLTGSSTLLHIGTFRATAATTTEDSFGGSTGSTGGKRFLWNRFNQEPMFAAVIETTDEWDYTTNTIRQARGTAGNKIEYVAGDAAMLILAQVLVSFRGTNNGANGAKVGVGVNTITAFSGLVGIGHNADLTTAVVSTMSGRYAGRPGLGYNYVAWNEKGAAANSKFYGDDAGSGGQSGLHVSWLG